MTTIRRLLLELGIVGDMTAKEKLKEVQESANSLKKTLEQLEVQLQIVGKSLYDLPTINNFGFIGKGVMTKQEREEATERINLLREQSRLQHEMDLKKLEQAKQTVKLQEQLKESLEKQVSEQSKLYTALVNELKADRVMFSNLLKNLENLMSQSQGYVAKTPRPLHKVGRPPKRYEYTYDKVKKIPVKRETAKWKAYIAEKRDLETELQDAQKEAADIVKDLKQKTINLGKKPASLQKLEDNIKQITDLLTKIKKNNKDDEIQVKPYIKAIPKQFTTMQPEVKPENKLPFVISQPKVKPENKLPFVISQPKVKPESRTPFLTRQYIVRRPEGLSDLPITGRIIPEKKSKNLESINKKLGKEISNINKKFKKIQEDIKKDQSKTLKQLFPTVNEEIKNIEQEIQRLKRNNVKISKKPLDIKKAQQTLKKLKKPSSTSISINNLISNLANAIKSSTNKVVTSLKSIKFKRKKQQKSVSLPAPPQFYKPKIAKVSKSDYEARMNKYYKDAVNKILYFSGLQKNKMQFNYPEANIVNIVGKMEQEAERKRVQEFIDKIRNKVKPDLEREELIRNRGFAIEPVEKIFSFRRKKSLQWQDFKENLKERMIKQVSKSKLITPSEEFIKKKKLSRIRSAADLVKKTKDNAGNVYKQYSIVFNNPLIDSKERKKQLIRDLHQALRSVE